MAIKNRLGKATFIATVFHWTWITALFFSLNLFQTKAQLAALEINYENLNMLNQIGAQLEITKRWVVTSAKALAISALLGYCSAWLYAKHQDIKRRKRMSGNGQFRGITCTLGNLPTPVAKSFEPIGIELPKNIKLNEKHHQLLCDILSVINSHEVPAGIGHSDLNLLEHTLNTIEKAIKINRTDPNLICAIAAHDIGKINTFKNVEGKWIVEGKHDDEGAKIIRELDSWWQLSDKDRFTILYAVKFSHKPTMVPTQIEHRDEIVKCIEGIRHIDHNVTREEKEETVTKLEDKKTLHDYFMQFLQVAPFRSPASPAGTKSGGWIKRNHCFMLESYFKDIYLKENHPEILAAYNELGKKKDNSRVSRELLKQLDAKGLLVKEWDDEKTSDPTQALWAIQCGNSTFIKVIIIPLTEEVHTLVGDQKFHQQLKVISLYSKYQKAQKLKNASGKPQAKLSQQNNGNKLQQDLDKIKAEKAKKEKNNPEKTEQNKHTKSTSVKNEPTNPNNKQKTNNQSNNQKPNTNNNSNAESATDKMFASFGMPEKTNDDSKNEEDSKQITKPKEEQKQEIKNNTNNKVDKLNLSENKQDTPTPPTEELHKQNETESIADNFREQLGIREINENDSVI